MLGSSQTGVCIPPTRTETMAMACHGQEVASMASVCIGLIPGVGGTTLWLRAVGRAELLQTARGSTA